MEPGAAAVVGVGSTTPAPRMNRAARWAEVQRRSQLDKMPRLYYESAPHTPKAFSSSFVSTTMRTLLFIVCSLALVAPVHSPAQQAKGWDPRSPGYLPAMAGSGELEISIVSYNIHGLPAWLAFDDPPARIRRIGALLKRYDVAFIQEDFAHHDILVEHTNHVMAIQGNGARSEVLSLFPFLCGTCGSGLTTLTHRSFGKLSEIQRQSFSECEGWVRHATDCWATKGFTRARVVLPNRRELDLYNVHLDAGTSVEDRKVRAAQMSQLRDSVITKTGRRAMILAGDLNLDRLNAADRKAIREFVTDLHLNESRASGRTGGWPRLLDYILFRGSEGIRLQPVEAGEALEFVRDGVPLSDHPAIYAKFRINFEEKQH